MILSRWPHSASFRYRFQRGGGSSGVDLRWHSRKQFAELTQYQKDELTEWLSSDAGKKSKKEFFAAKKAARKEKDSDSSKGKRKNEGEPGNAKWKKQLRKRMKTPKGLAAVMSFLAKEEESNAGLVAALTQAQASATTATAVTTLPPAPTNPAPVAPAAAQIGALSQAYPATNTKVTSILKNRKA